MISMTLSFSSYEEAIDALRGIKTGNVINVQPLPELSVQEPAAPVVIKTAKVEAPKPVKAEKPAATASKQADAASGTPPNSELLGKTETALESPSDVTYKQVADAVTAYSKKATRPVAAALLGTFGVAALPQAKPEQYEEILKAFELALEEHEAELV